MGRGPIQKVYQVVLYIQKSRLFLLMSWHLYFVECIYTLNFKREYCIYCAHRCSAYQYLVALSATSSGVGSCGFSLALAMMAEIFWIHSERFLCWVRLSSDVTNSSPALLIQFLFCFRTFEVNTDCFVFVFTVSDWQIRIQSFLWT